MHARRAAFAKIIREGGNTPLEMSGKWWRDADLGERPERRRSGLTVRGSPAGGGRSGRSCGTASGAQLPSDCSRRRPFDHHSGNCAGDGRTRRSCDRPCQRCRHRRLQKKGNRACNGQNGADEASAPEGQSRIKCPTFPHVWHVLSDILQRPERSGRPNVRRGTCDERPVDAGDRSGALFWRRWTTS
jgi:hypothetical protein